MFWWSYVVHTSTYYIGRIKGGPMMRFTAEFLQDRFRTPCRMTERFWPFQRTLHSKAEGQQCVGHMMAQTLSCTSSHNFCGRLVHHTSLERHPEWRPLGGMGAWPKRPKNRLKVRRTWSPGERRTQVFVFFFQTFNLLKTHSNPSNIVCFCPSLLF